MLWLVQWYSGEALVCFIVHHQVNIHVWIEASANTTLLARAVDWERECGGREAHLTPLHLISSHLSSVKLTPCLPPQFRVFSILRSMCRWTSQIKVLCTLTCSFYLAIYMFMWFCLNTQQFNILGCVLQKDDKLNGSAEKLQHNSSFIYPLLWWKLGSTFCTKCIMIYDLTLLISNASTYTLLDSWKINLRWMSQDSA